MTDHLHLHLSVSMKGKNIDAAFYIFTTMFTPIFMGVHKNWLKSCISAPYSHIVIAISVYIRLSPAYLLILWVSRNCKKEPYFYQPQAKRLCTSHGFIKMSESYICLQMEFCEPHKKKLFGLSFYCCCIYGYSVNNASLLLWLLSYMISLVNMSRIFIFWASYCLCSSFIQNSLKKMHPN